MKLSYNKLKTLLLENIEANKNIKTVAHEMTNPYFLDTLFSGLQNTPYHDVNNILTWGDVIVDAIKDDDYDALYEIIDNMQIVIQTNHYPDGNSVYPKALNAFRKWENILSTELEKLKE